LTWSWGCVCSQQAIRKFWNENCKGGVFKRYCFGAHFKERGLR
jgi:hypothetical protein